MKAILCTHFGGPADLEYQDLPNPQPGSGEVVVAVKAAALNFFDTLIIAGKYQLKPPFPFSPASEFAGWSRHRDRVTAVAPAIACSAGGFGRARKGRDRAQHGENPGRARLRRAAGLTVIYGTTLHALKDRAKLNLARRWRCSAHRADRACDRNRQTMGARVIACASSEEKLAFCTGRRRRHQLRERGFEGGTAPPHRRERSRRRL